MTTPAESRKAASPTESANKMPWAFVRRCAECSPTDFYAYYQGSNYCEFGHEKCSTGYWVPEAEARELCEMRQMVVTLLDCLDEMSRHIDFQKDMESKARFWQTHDKLRALLAEGDVSGSEHLSEKGGSGVL